MTALQTRSDLVHVSCCEAPISFVCQVQSRPSKCTVKSDRVNAVDRTVYRQEVSPADERQSVMELPLEPTGANMTTNKSLPIVLITGSSGFLGQAITNGLKGRYRVIGFDLPNARQTAKGTETVPVDLTSDDSVTKAVEEVRERGNGRIASVIHLAAYYDTTGKTIRNMTPSRCRERVGCFPPSRRWKPSSSSSPAPCSSTLRVRKRE